MEQSPNMDDDPIKKPVPDNLAFPVEPPIPATPENMPKDVVGTRRRNWQNHPGNQYYREQVTKYRDLLMAHDNKKSLRTLASELVQVIVKRGAVFLRADEQEGGWYVMDENACIHKATLAMKNAEIKKRGASQSSSTPGDGGGPKKKKKNTPPPATAMLQKPTTQPPRLSRPRPTPLPQERLSSNESVGHKQELPPIEYKEGTPPERETHRRYFDIIEGNVSVSQYTKDIIILMCNQTNASKAATVLDEPLVLDEEESDKQRLLRLQLRQRYIAALTIGMSPINFSLKLMELWGGSLVEKRIPIEQAKPNPAPETQSEDTTQASDEVKVVDGKLGSCKVENTIGKEDVNADGKVGLQHRVNEGVEDSGNEGVVGDLSPDEKEGSNEVGQGCQSQKDDVRIVAQGGVNTHDNNVGNSDSRNDVGGNDQAIDTGNVQS